MESFLMGKSDKTDPHEKHRITVFPLCFSFSFVWLWEMGCICCSSCSVVVPGGERLIKYMLNAMDPMCTSSYFLYFSDKGFEGHFKSESEHVTV